MGYVKPKTMTLAESDLIAAFGLVNALDAATDLREFLTGFRISKTAGAAQSTAASLFGMDGATETALITENDTIIRVIQFLGHGGTSGLTSITLRADFRVSNSTPGLIRFTGGATTGSQILVFWLNTSGYVAETYQ